MTTAAHTHAAPAALATVISRWARLRAAWWLSWAMVPLAFAASLGGLLLVAGPAVATLNAFVARGM